MIVTGEDAADVREDPAESNRKQDDIFASTSASDGVEGETTKVGNIVLRWMVLRPGRANNL